MSYKNCYNQFINIVHFKYDEASVSQRSQINTLIGSIWKEDSSLDAHSPFFKVMSFCAYAGDSLVGYAAVLSWHLRIGHEIFNACGLSCVCTHPDYRKKTIGKNIVTEASRWIIESGIFDLGIFTCAKSLTTFYEQTGIWKKDDSLILIGSMNNEFISSHMDLDVLKCILSDKGQAKCLESTTIVLGFPDGEFI